MIFHLHFRYSLDQSRRRQLVLYRMCIYLSSIELKLDRIAGNLQGVRHCCKPPVSVLMRVVVLDCKRDRLARFDFAEASEHFCLEVLACCHVWESRLAFAGGSLALAAKVPSSRSLVERRCPSLSISRTDPHAATRAKGCSTAGASLPHGFLPWMLVASRQHCTMM